MKINRKFQSNFTFFPLNSKTKKKKFPKENIINSLSNEKPFQQNFPEKKTVKWKFSSKNPNLISQMMRDMFMQQAKKKKGEKDLI